MTPPIGTNFRRSVVESDQVRQVNFLSRTCWDCGEGISLGAGDVLFGDRWYHGHCWDKLRGAISETSKTG
jgi:ribosomal protein S27AE